MANRLLVVIVGAFSDLVLLTRLEAYSNQLTTISPTAFSVLPTRIHSFYMNDNPLLYCDSQLCWIFDEIADGTTMYQQPLTVCNGPPALAGRSWNTLNQNDLNCGGLYLLNPISELGFFLNTFLIRVS